MVRNLFVLSLLSLSFVGCVGPEKGPSPVTDGGIDPVGAPSASLTPVTAAPVAEAAPAPAAPVKKSTAPAKSRGRLPISNAGNK